MLCPKCAFLVPPNARYCPVDQTDVGFPNVRAAESAEEVQALDNRWAVATDDAQTRTCLPILEDFGRAGLHSKALICRDLKMVQLLVSGDSALDRKSTRLNSSHLGISYAVFCLKKKHI